MMYILTNSHVTYTVQACSIRQYMYIKSMYIYEGCLIIPRSLVLLYMQRRWFLSFSKDHPPAWR